MAGKKRKTWLWIIGWILCFPIPLTILVFRNKRLSTSLRYGVIATAWILFAGFFIFGRPSSKEATTEKPAAQERVKETEQSEDRQQTKAEEQEESESSADDRAEVPEEDQPKPEPSEQDSLPKDSESEEPAPAKAIYDLTAGETNEYSWDFVADNGDGTTYTKHGFVIPAGTYKVDNLDSKYATQVTAYSKETMYEDGVEYPAESAPILVFAGEAKTLEVPEGWWVYITEPAHVLLTEQ